MVALGKRSNFWQTKAVKSEFIGDEDVVCVCGRRWRFSSWTCDELDSNYIACLCGTVLREWNEYGWHAAELIDDVPTQ